MLIAATFNDESARARETDALDAALQEVVDVLIEAEPQLTNSLRGFAERLRHNAEQASQTMSSASDYAEKRSAAHSAFSADLEDYPGYDEYSEAAHADPNCPQP